MNFTPIAMKFFPLVMYLILVSFGFVVCQTGECPSVEDVSPCNCSLYQSEAEVECFGIENYEQLIEVANKTTDWIFPWFDIKNSTFNYLPTKIIIEKKVTNLGVYHSVMAGLFEKVVPANSKLEGIILSDLVLTSGLKWEHFSKLHDLDRLIISFVEIKKIDQTFIDNVPKGLQILQLYDTKTKTLDDFAFANLPNLVQMYIAANDITTLKRSMFPPECRIYSFHIAHTKISYLPDDIFSNWPRLNYVRLEGNNIAVIQESVLRSVLPHVYTLNLEGNDIDCNCQMKWVTTVTLPRSTTGACQTPKALKGLAIADLKADHFSHCQ